VLRRFGRASEGLATIEYIIGAAVVRGTLVIGSAPPNAKNLGAAGQVEGRLMLVLVLSYLQALICSS
jgi:hypothetical protein